jgi:hypothetical protein
VSTRHRIACPSEIVGQILFHLRRRVVGHRG